MFAKGSLKERCHVILEQKGGKIAEQARTMLVRERSLAALRLPLEYASLNWRDPTTPSLVVLSCEAVGGKPSKAIYQVASAVTLMNLSFTLWDSILDKHMHRCFIPTVLGKYGEGVTLIIGGLASAKAFSILNEVKVNEATREKVITLVWNYWGKLANAETAHLELKGRSNATSREKFKVFEMEGIGVETSLRIGAVLGNGSEDEVEHLGNYGRYLGTVLELMKDFRVSINLTMELAERIESGSLPYTLLWAKDRSEKIREYLLLPKRTIEPTDVRSIVEAIFQAKAQVEIPRLLRRLTRKAETELLQLKRNEAADTLKFFFEAQSEIFADDLAILPDHE